MFLFVFNMLIGLLSINPACTRMLCLKFDAIYSGHFFVIVDSPSCARLLLLDTLLAVALQYELYEATMRTRNDINYERTMICTSDVTSSEKVKYLQREVRICKRRRRRRKVQDTQPDKCPLSLLVHFDAYLDTHHFHSILLSSILFIHRYRMSLMLQY